MRRRRWRRIGRVSDLRAFPANSAGFLMTVASRVHGPVPDDGVRSRLPLRGSPGFKPGSLFRRTTRDSARGANRFEKRLGDQGVRSQQGPGPGPLRGLYEVRSTGYRDLD